METATEDEETQGTETDPDREEKFAGDTPLEKKKFASALKELAAILILHHVGKGNYVK